MSDRCAGSAFESYRARRYFPELDGVRALCVLLVVTVHLYDAHERWWWLAGARGVTVFFVLSGYLITSLGLREEAERGTLSLAAFYVRRCCRLLPLYYLTLAAYCVLIFGLGVGGPSLRETMTEALPYYVTYFQEIPFYSLLIGGGRDLPFFHSWSLGIEEKFYLVWPLLAFVLWRGLPRRRLTGAVVLLTAFALAPFVLHQEMRLVGRCLFSYFHLLVGCVVAMLLHDRHNFERLRFLGRAGWRMFALGVFVAIHFATPWVAEPSHAGTALHALYGIACAVLLVALVTGGGLLDRLLAWEPLALVGRLSYGIYLVHLFAIVAAYRLVPAWGGAATSALVYFTACGLSVAAAWLLALAVERPGIEVGRRWSRRLLDRAAVEACEAPAVSHRSKGESRSALPT